MSNYDLNATFNMNSATAKQIYGSVLMPNMDTNENIFYARHGMIATTSINRSTRAPIQNVTEPQNMRGAKFRCYMSWYMSGDPDVGAESIARDDATVIPQPSFEFSVAMMYSPALRIPHEFQDRLMVISITQNYRMQLASYWGSIVAEYITTSITGLRGEADTNYGFVAKQTGSVTDISTSATATLSESLKLLNKVNPISTPQRTHTTWRTGFDTSKAISATSAASTNVIDIQDFNELYTYLDTRTVRREGFALEEPMVRWMNEDQTRGAQYRKGWPIVMLPEHMRDLRKTQGAGSWAEIQLAAAGRVGFKQGMNDANVGDIFGLGMMKYNKLPRYYGGAAGDVSIARCMILGAQAVCVAIQNSRLSPEYQVQMNPRMRKMSQMGIPVRTWVVGKNSDRTGELHSQMKLACAKMVFTRPDTQEVVDKGVFTWDVPFTSMERGGIL